MDSKERVGDTFRMVFFNAGLDKWFSRASQIHLPQIVGEYTDGDTINRALMNLERLVVANKNNQLRNFGSIHFTEGNRIIHLMKKPAEYVSSGYNGHADMNLYIRYIYTMFNRIFKDSLICATEVCDYAMNEISGVLPTSHPIFQLIQSYYMGNVYESKLSVKNRCFISKSNNIHYPIDLYNQMIDKGSLDNGQPHPNGYPIAPNTTNISGPVSNFMCQFTMCFGHIQFGEYYAGSETIQNKILICNIHLRLKYVNAGNEFIDCLAYLVNEFFGNYQNIIIGGDFNARLFNTTYYDITNNMTLGARILQVLNGFNSLHEDFAEINTATNMHVLYKLKNFNIKKIKIPQTDWNENTFIANSHLPIHVELTRNYDHLKEVVDRELNTLRNIQIWKKFSLLKQKISRYLRNLKSHLESKGSTLENAQVLTDYIITQSMIQSISTKITEYTAELKEGKNTELNTNIIQVLTDKLENEKKRNPYTEALIYIDDALVKLSGIKSSKLHDVSEPAMAGGYIYNKTKYNKLILFT